MMVVFHLMNLMGRLGNIIHSRKEIVDSTNLGVTGGVRTTIPIVSVVNDYVGAVGTVETGSVVKSVYVFFQILPALGTANVDWYFIKKPSGVTDPVPGAVGGTPQRKYVLHEEKGIPGNAGDGAYPLTFKGVIKIPRGRQRMAEGDTINLVASGVDDYNACMKAIYKVYM